TGLPSARSTTPTATATCSQYGRWNNTTIPKPIDIHPPLQRRVFFCNPHNFSPQKSLLIIRRIAGGGLCNDIKTFYI
ncbi:MAG: hypothetical protein J6W45_09325, partial [Bacteroidales bacterium]|nr:hypothetical protein [Bacteroidales bacterium]